MSIPERIKEAIKLLEMTPNAFATHADIDPSNLNKMLEGKQNITDKTIGKICSAHHLSTEWVKNGVGEMKVQTPNKGNYLSPGSIYAEDSKIVMGDLVLRERIKHLQASIHKLQEEKEAWEAERKSLKSELTELRAKYEAAVSEHVRTKDKMIELLMERCK